LGWQGSQFVRTDGVRTGSTVWQQAKASGVNNTASAADVHDQDLAAAISTSLQVDGKTKPTADLDWNGKKILNAGAASARTHLPLASQVQDGSFNYAAATGTANSIIVALSPAITAYADGMAISFRASANTSGTGATMLNVNSVGAKRITRSDGRNLQSSDFGANRIYTVYYSSATDTFNAPVYHYLTAGNVDSRIANTVGVTVQGYDANTLKSNATKTLTAGYMVTAVNDGTKSSGTYTPDPTGGAFREVTNNGAHTLAPPTNTGSTTMIVEYTNGASAGAITTSGWTKVTGDAFTTTSGNKFKLYISKGGTGTHLHIQAMQ
jgi:hypothetical protein